MVILTIVTALCGRVDGQSLIANLPLAIHTHPVHAFSDALQCVFDITNFVDVAVDDSKIQIR
jgi:hypothetical protein